MQEIVDRIVQSANLRRRGRRFVGACPVCGGSEKSDRFVLHQDGGYKCYGCGIKGDVITWLRKQEGMSCGQAHEAAGKPCTNFSCPGRARCRMGDGKTVGGHGVSSRILRRRRAMKSCDDQAPGLSISDRSMPSPSWLSWATGLQRVAARELMRNHDELAWLAGRGIGQEAARRFGLGWLASNTKVDRSAIGLPRRDDGKTRLWVPAGLLIPISTESGLHRLRVRRTPAERDRFLPDLKYVWIEGSGTGPMQIEPSSGRARGAVIVEAELDAMAIAAAHHDVMVVALGSVSAGIDTSLSDRLSAMPVILVSLDADQPAAGKPAAGPRAVAAWRERYRQARFWPVPSGKDPGEYHAAGGNLRDWIEAGLPPVVGHDSVSSGCNDRGGGMGAVQNNGQAGEKETNGPVWYEIDVAGRAVCLTDDRDQWLRLASSGRVVFSANELKRLGQACAALSEDEAVVLRERVMDMKEVMGTAYIYRGGGRI